MTRDEARSLLAHLIGEIAPEVDLGGVDENALLQEGLDIDSVDFLTLVTLLHDETGIDIPERDYPKVSTVAGFLDYLMSARAALAG